MARAAGFLGCGLGTLFFLQIIVFMNNLSLSSEPITQLHRENKAQETPTINTKQTGKHRESLSLVLLVMVTADGLMRRCNVALFAFLVFCLPGNNRIGIEGQDLGKENGFLFFLFISDPRWPFYCCSRTLFSRLITEQQTKKVSRRQGIGDVGEEMGK